MLIFLLSLAFAAMVFGIGAAVVQAISIIPLSILACAAEAGRYVRLGWHEQPSVTPSGGRRILSLPAACGPLFNLAGAEVP